MASAGASTGRKGATSCERSTSFAIFSVITAHLRFVAVLRSLKPRCSSGTVIESAAALTVYTNVVAASACTHSCTSAPAP